MDFNISEEQQKNEKKARDFAQREIAPHVPRLEDDLSFRKELFVKMAKEGFFSAYPDFLSYGLALKAIAKADAGISVAMSITHMVMDALKKFGTEEQKQHYLPKITAGECVPLSFALTEKKAGSDAKSIQAEAIPDTKDSQVFVLNGEKHFITNGDTSGMVLVLARTEQGKGSHGITAFLVDQGTSGFSMSCKERKLGLLTANLVGLRFEQCRVPRNRVLGQQGEGFQIAMASLDNGRLGIAAQSLGIAEAAFEAALHYAKHRHQFGRAIADNQAIAFKLADMRMKLDAAHLLLYKACWLKDRGEPCTLEVSEAKLFCSEAANFIADQALQIHGGYGYVKDYPAEKYFRDARATTLYEGTSEIQRLIISRHLLKD